MAHHHHPAAAPSPPQQQHPCGTGGVVVPQHSSLFMNYPLKHIPQPHAHDVLCGRGGQSNSHPGNTQWRMLVAANKELYVSLPKKQKMLLSQSIVNAVRSQHPPGRFLQKDAKTDYWYDVGDKRAQEKTSQALREGAPEIRSKLKDETPSTNTTDTVADTTPVNDKVTSSSSRAGDSGQEATADGVATTAKQQEQRQPPPKNSWITANEQMPPPAPAVPQQQQQGPVIGMIPDQRSVQSNSYTTILQPPPFKETTRSAAASYQVRFQERDYNRNHHRHHHAAVAAQRQQSFVPPPPRNQLRYVPDDNNNNDQDTNDAAMPPPPCAMDANGEFSFGSMGLISDAEQAQLMNGVSFGSVMSYNNNNNHNGRPSERGRYDHQQHQQQYSPHQYPSYQQQQQQEEIPLPVDGGLEPIGLSFGSMMSIGTSTVGAAAAAAAEAIRLESAGLSFGSTMSYTTTAGGGTAGAQHAAGAAGGHARYGSFGGYSSGGDQYHPHSMPPQPDGGLQDIGTSFGSLSLAEGERERLTREAAREMMLDDDDAATAASTGGGGVPTFLQQHKSKGNLLECSDTESDDEETSAEASAQKSVEWDKLQAALAAQEHSVRTTHSTAAMPSPLCVGREGGGNSSSRAHPAPGTTFSIPTTGLDRDLSQMSAISVGEDFGPAPPAAYGDYVVPTAIYGGNINTGLHNNSFDGAALGFHSDNMPPPPSEMKRGKSEDWKEDEQDFEYPTYLDRGYSLASETFSEPKDPGKTVGL